MTSGCRVSSGSGVTEGGRAMQTNHGWFILKTPDALASSVQAPQLDVSAPG